MFIDAASLLADFLSEAAPAARHGRAMVKAGAVEPNSRCFQKARKCTCFSGLPAPLSNYRVERNGSAVLPGRLFQCKMNGLRLRLLVCDCYCLKRKTNFPFKEQQSHPNNRTLRIDVLGCKTNVFHLNAAVCLAKRRNHTASATNGPKNESEGRLIRIIWRISAATPPGQATACP